ncbi:hypothetical protein B0H67DRAFT_593173 [Lasiosphaeris hirsuta]|uniref:Uncharacterized protein n=1 Tax=Lasiosphaeris hirsuta TaxID=260670 RepID=A0AA40DIR0_9PEZI|nr:hypothetical protein B0H67DRAFT_593173 [Lasiosphaeris hirsuta]
MTFKFYPRHGFLMVSSTLASAANSRSNRITSRRCQATSPMTSAIVADVLGNRAVCRRQLQAVLLADWASVSAERPDGVPLSRRGSVSGIFTQTRNRHRPVEESTYSPTLPCLAHGSSAPVIVGNLSRTSPARSRISPRSIYVRLRLNVTLRASTARWVWVQASRSTRRYPISFQKGLKIQPHSEGASYG